MSRYETRESRIEIRELYDDAFAKAEQTVNAKAHSVNTVEIVPVLTAARRVGRIMQMQFPDTAHVPWVSTDVEITYEVKPPDQAISEILTFIESTIWAYQPVWTVYADAVSIHTRQEINREEIEIIAFESVDKVVRWRWNPVFPDPARELSKYVASHLKYLDQDVFRRVDPDLSLNVLPDDLISDPQQSPEEILIEKETIYEELDRLQMTVADLCILEGNRSDRNKLPFIPKHIFPVPVRHPLGIWGFMHELDPRERMAMLYSLGYIYHDRSVSQLEKEIGLHNGHFKAILHKARQKVYALWHTDHYEDHHYAMDDIQAMIEEALLRGPDMPRLIDGRIDRSRVRQQLRIVLEHLGPDGLTSLPKQRSKVVTALLNGYTSEEVGKQLGISRKTVVDHAGKALTALLEQLER
jgi:hypothetical protein